METSTDLIKKERELKQIKKHGFTAEHHAKHPEWYGEGQLIQASNRLALKKSVCVAPKNWDSHWFGKLCLKSHYERLIIAASFLAAEYERIEYLDTHPESLTN